MACRVALLDDALARGSMEDVCVGGHGLWKKKRKKGKRVFSHPHLTAPLRLADGSCMEGLKEETRWHTGIGLFLLAYLGSG